MVGRKRKSYMKQRIQTLFLSLAGIACSATAQTLSVAPIEVEAGGEATLVVSASGLSDVTALQFNLQLPEGITLAGSSQLGDGASTHTLDVRPLASGDNMFVFYNLDKALLTDGELMTEKYGFTNQRFYEVKSRWAFATPYALNKKLHKNYGSKLQKDGKYGTVGYWVAALKRDENDEQKPGRYLQICAGIEESHKKGDTNIGHLSFGYLNRTTIGLRLALRLDTSRIQVISGNGSIWDPCRLAYVADKEAPEKEILTPPVRPEPTPVPMTPAPVKGRPTLAPPDPDATPVPVPEWIKEGAD